MITLSMLAACAISVAPNDPTPVAMGRVFTKGEKLAYSVSSRLNAESRSGEVTTWMPEDLDIDYDFTVEVKELKADGIAVLRYLRPKMTITEGETFDSPPKAKVEKVNLDALLTISPINEMIEFKENKAATSKGFMLPNAAAVNVQSPLAGILGQFVGEMYRLALFSGSLDSALDFTPKMSSTTMAVGDTWHKTVGYQPQKKNKAGKSVVQRLDYEYTYKGPVTVNGKKFERIEAKLDLKTDLADFINDTYDVTAEVTGIRTLPLTMKSSIVFNLDPVTRHTVSAEAQTEGGYQIFLTQGSQQRAIQESKMRGRSTMRLVNRTVAK